MFSSGGSYDFTYVLAAADRTREKPSVDMGDEAMSSSKSTYIATRADGSVEVSCDKRLSIRKAGQVPIELLTEILEAIDTSSKAAQTQVINRQLKPLIEPLKKFKV